MASSAPVRTVLHALGKTDLDPAEREELETEIESLIFRGSFVRMVSEMEDDVLEAWKALIERDASEEEFSSFLKEHVPHASRIATETAEEYAGDILAAQHN